MFDAHADDTNSFPTAIPANSSDYSHHVRWDLWFLRRGAMDRRRTVPAAAVANSVGVEPLDDTDDTVGTRDS